MSGFNPRRFQGRELQPVAEIKVMVLQNGILRVLPSVGLDPDDPKHLTQMMDMMLGGVTNLAEKRAGGMTGEGKQILVDAVKQTLGALRGLIQMHLPGFERKLIQEVPAGAVTTLHG